MKRLFLLVLLVASIVFFNHSAYASEARIEVGVGQNQTSITGDQYSSLTTSTDVANQVKNSQGMVGGTQSMVFNGDSSGDIKRVLSSLSQFATTDLPYAARIIFNPNQIFKPWKEKPFYLYDELLSREEIIATLKSGKTIFQSVRKPKNITYNTGPVIILPKLPGNPFLPELWSFFHEGPTNGFNRKTFQEAASIAKGVTNTNYIVMIPVEAIFSKNKMNSFGIQSGITSIQHNSSPAISGSANTGGSEARAWRVPGVYVICYPRLDYVATEVVTLIKNINLKPQQLKQPLSHGQVPAKDNRLLSIIPYGDDCNTDEKISKAIQQNAKNIKELLDNGKIIGFESFDNDDTRSLQMADTVMKKFGQALLGTVSAEILESQFRMRSKKHKTEKEKLRLRELEKDKIHGVVIVSVIGIKTK